MYKTVQVPSGFFDLVPHLIIAVQIEHIRYEVEGVLVPLYVCIQSR